MRKNLFKWLSVSLLLVSFFVSLQAQTGWLRPDMLKMNREQIRFTDNQLRLFNGRGVAHVKRYSLTGIHRLQFIPIDLGNYSFYLDFLDKASGVLIQDKVPDFWDDYERYGIGTDPLGANFRSGFATVPVTQDEYWEPNHYVRFGTFHKEYGHRLVSFGVKTETVVSARKDEVLLKMVLTNRTNQPLEMSLIPHQQVSAKDTVGVFRRLSPFALVSRGNEVSLKSNLTATNKSWEVTVPAKGEKEVMIALRIGKEGFTPDDKANLDTDYNTAMQDTRARFDFASQGIPRFRSDNKRLEDFYNRCIATMLECRWDRDDFIIKPFWAVGSWIFTITWDNSFASDAISMMDAASMKRTILIAMQEGRLKSTYISWKGGGGNIFYVQEPFALKTMIDAYLRQTGDVAFLDEKVSGKSVMEWMKAWGDLLRTKYRSPVTGLIDMGKRNEELIEMRTDGYSGVVPVVNGLAVDLYKWLDKWCTVRKDTAATKFRDYGTDLENRMHTVLWDGSAHWFDNLYPDGRRQPMFSNHLFDLLGTNSITAEERLGILSHINDQEFLGPFSVYSISRQDKIHWDLIDADWGGGGSFTGVPLRLVRNLYNMGQSALAWKVLSRFSRYADYFPYMGQNMRANEPLQDESSMPIQISSGAGVEAVVFGLFGLHPSDGDTMTIRPYYNLELGRSTLEGYHFRGHSYSVALDESGFTISRDGQPAGMYNYGDEVFVDAKGSLSIKNGLPETPYATAYDPFFVKNSRVELAADNGAEIRYTTDGTRPVASSPRYVKPFVVDKSTLVQAVVVKDGKVGPVAEIPLQQLQFRDKAHLANVINKYPYPEVKFYVPLGSGHPPVYGAYTALDGISGGDTYSDGEWIGQDKNDIGLEITWDNPIDIQQVSTRFMHFQPDWIFTPRAFVVEASADGVHYKKLGEQTFELKVKFNKKELVPALVRFPRQKVKSLRITAKSIGVCPPWHEGAGANAWTFMDEVVVE